LIAIAFFGELHEERGVLLTFAAVLYALSSALAGMLSGSFYQQNGGKQWIRTALLTATTFPAFVAVVGLILDLFATGYRSQSSIPLGTLFLLLLLWAAVAFPLTIVGSMVGRHVGPFRAPPPCKVSQVIKREKQKKNLLFGLNVFV
jgi:transmembrane 9 superfamily protein 3